VARAESGYDRIQVSAFLWLSEKPVRLTFLAALILIRFSSSIAAQSSFSPTRGIDLPRGPLTRIRSPDRKWTLIFECPNNCAERKLWIEASGSSGRRLVKAFERDLSVSWAPDSRLFVVNDAYGSNGTDCYLYDPATLKQTDLADLLVAGDPRVAEYRKVGHAYLQATRWVTSRVLLVTLSGHFDEPPARGFTFRFQVGLDGAVRKVSESQEERQR
jgi:hypothetical protein